MKLKDLPIGARFQLPPYIVVGQKGAYTDIGGIYGLYNQLEVDVYKTEKIIDVPLGSVIRYDDKEWFVFNRSDNSVALVSLKSERNILSNETLVEILYTPMVRRRITLATADVGGRYKIKNNSDREVMVIVYRDEKLAITCGDCLVLDDPNLELLEI